MNLHFPSIYLLPAHISSSELEDFYKKIPSLTTDLSDTELIVGRISRPERAVFELRRLGLQTSPLTRSSNSAWSSTSITAQPHSNESENAAGTDSRHSEAIFDSPRRELAPESTPPSTIRVIRLQWVLDSLQEQTVLPTGNYIVYEGILTSSSTAHKEAQAQSQGKGLYKAGTVTSADVSGATDSQHVRTALPAHRPPLLHESTSDHDLELPPIPPFLETTYSCSRPTLIDPPNGSFVVQLKEVRTLRLLQGDRIGVRAYSTAIATLAAYPYVVRAPKEIARLPGCSSKIALLWEQWKESGTLAEITEAEKDPKMTVLRTFYNIWGVGDTTARQFYKDGWRDRDDLAEYAWSSLSRVQQIGLKYYDDFLLKIPRAEVEQIAAIILDSTLKLDPDYQMIIVGGHRRGKAESGDVDVILSHPKEEKTVNLVKRVARNLEASGHIRWVLSLTSKNSERGQTAVPWRGNHQGGTGFDTLDKALVVWKDPLESSLPYRRVDIIISPWKTVGCAVLGWSGGTTFQRDLRRYCKSELDLKFDSSGIRRRSDGAWVDLEQSDVMGTAKDMVEAERRVFSGLSLPYCPPEQRCTG